MSEQQPIEETTQPPVLLELNQVSVRYGSKIAVEDISFTLPAGKILGLVGPNGAGKSSLLAALSGAVTASSGEILLDGRPYTPDSVADARSVGVGYVPQHIELHPELTAAEAIFRTSFEDLLSEFQKIEKANQLIRDYGLDFGAEEKVRDLAPAEWASLELLRMTSENARLILLDEVTASFNDLEISLFHALARKLVAEGRSIIHVSHRLDELHPLSDQIAVLREGRLKSVLVARDVRRRELLEEIFETPIPVQKRPTPTNREERATLFAEQVVAAPKLAGPVDLHVHPGEILGLTGLRRSGVNELTEILGGARVPDSGSVQLHEIPVELGSLEAALERGIAYVPEARQDQDLDLDQTLEHSLDPTDDTDETGAAGEAAAAPELSYLDRSRQLIRTFRTLQQFGVAGAGSLEETETTTVGELSGGDQQKIALARAIGNEDAEIFVFNQPTRSIDELAKHRIYELFDQLVAEGKAVVFTTSDLSELVSRCHRIGVLRDGELVSVRPNPAHTEDSIMFDCLGPELA